MLIPGFWSNAAQPPTTPGGLHWTDSAMEAEEIMIHPDRRPCPATSRWGFLARTLGVGLGLGAAETLTPPGRAHAEVAPLDPALSEYERILSHTDSLEILG